MTIYLDKIPSYPPVIKNPDGTIQHVECSGARFHVIWYSTGVGDAAINLWRQL